ncbi:MAG: LamG domain-containing protein [Armatimonadota bacterium]
MLFNVDVFGGQLYNEPMPGATLQGVGGWQCSAVYQAAGTAQLAGLGSMACASVMDAVASAMLAGLGQLAASAKQTWASRFGEALAITAAYGEKLLVPSSVIFLAAGSVSVLIYLLRAPGTTEQVVFDGAGPENKNLQVVVTTSGKLALRYGTGAATVEMTSTETLRDGEVYWVGFGWDDNGVALYLNGGEVASSTQPPSLSFGTNICIGAKADSTCQLDGLIDCLQFSSRCRTASEFLATYQLQMPPSWDVDTTYLLLFNNNLNLPAARQGVWVSPVQDARSAESYDYIVNWLATVPNNTAVAVQTRTSADGVIWSPWYDQVNDSYSTAPPNPYSQVRVILQTLDGTSTPVLSQATVVYGGKPSMAPLETGLGVADVYTFAQLQDVLVICNGVDVPRKYDGTATMQIAAAPRAYLVAPWRNRLFMAKTAGNRSRIYFSELGNVDSWPASYFIDINPNDGDELVCLLPGATAFLLIKQRHTYYLQGYTPEDFSIVPAGEGGTISPWGAIWTPRGVFLLDRRGVWITDFRRRSLVTRKIQRVWDGLNQRNLHRAALFYLDDRLLVAAPSAGAATNDTVLVYDMRSSGSQAWTVWKGWQAACFAEFRERGRWSCLFGASDRGNVFQIAESDVDAGVALAAKAETAHVPLVAPDWLACVRWCDVQFAGGAVAGTCRVTPILDGASGPTSEVYVPANAHIYAARLYPPPWARVLGMRIEWPEASAQGPTFLGATVTYFPRAPRLDKVV